jgi:hypothetical protein
MVFVWLTAFFLVVALIVLVIYQVSAAPRGPNSLAALGSVGSYCGRFPAKIEAARAVSRIGFRIHTSLLGPILGDLGSRASS